VNATTRVAVMAALMSGAALAQSLNVSWIHVPGPQDRFGGSWTTG